jgi:F-type H+-transporting ATPase subunit delta
MITEKLVTLARPYALAAFEYALAKSDLAGWESMLKAAAEVVQDKRITQLLNSPEVTKERLAQLFCGILASIMDNEKENFIRLLAEYDRLSALPNILSLFEEYKANYEMTLPVQVISAIPLDETFKQRITKSLTERLKRKVELQSEIDESLLGGVVIRAGDRVIDGSIRGKLNRLIEFIER